MKKQEFLAELWKQLSDAPKEDVERSLDYFTEMIDDRIESGMSEEEAVAEVGSPAEAAKQIIADLPKRSTTRVKVENTAQQAGTAAANTANSAAGSTSTVKPSAGNGNAAQRIRTNSAEYNEAYDEQIDRMMNRTPEKPQKKSSGGKVILLICLFPLWLPLLITAASLIFAFFVTLWSLTIAFFAVAGGFILAGIAGVVSLFVNAIHGEFAIGLVHAGAGFILSGLAIFFFMISSNIVKGTARVSAAIWRKITGFFRGKETTV